MRLAYGIKEARHNATRLSGGQFGINRGQLEQIYEKYNRHEFVHPDPIEFLYNYDDLRDREIVGLVAASLAYGKVGQILRSIRKILVGMGDSPYDFVMDSSVNALHDAFVGFKHRFTTGEEIGRMLIGVKSVLEQFGSLENCFMAGYRVEDENVIPALSAFTNRIAIAFEDNCSYLIPSPTKGSACKRMNLFLRWMVRKDDIDPGGWQRISPAKLIVPLDTHMHRIALALALTERKQANLCTAIEITEAFRKFAPEDPVKYDFALTRFGIRDDTELTGIIKTIASL